MKVVALGAGEVGQWAARALLLDDRVEDLIVADRRAESAEETATSLGSRARPLTVDVLDTSRLQAVLRGSDVVVNTVGPFYRFGVPILRAAIRAGCNYLDICDDWEPTVEMLGLDAEARAARVTAVIGLGASPGLSNLLAVKAIRALDEAESVLTVWSLDSAVPEPTPKGPTKGSREPGAATIHGIHQLTGRIRAFEEGREVSRRPLRRIEIDYPGIGRRYAWTIGHPEAVTLPRVFPQLRRSTNAMFSQRSTIALMKMLMGLVDLHLVSVERVARWVEGLEWVRPPDSLISPVKSGSASPVDLPPLFALAMGTKKGEPARAGVALTAAPPGGMGGITGIPLALAVSLLADGALNRSGVFPPEAIIKPDALLAKLLPFCEPRLDTPDDLAFLSTSWNEVNFWEAIEKAS
jgi:saccharopine dehydrogenase-like NADP-dependent oxidoreductase